MLACCIRNICRSYGLTAPYPSIFLYRGLTFLRRRFDSVEKCAHQKEKIIFAWHLLAVHKQQPGKSLQQFLQVLKCLSKYCSFKGVTAEQYCDDLLRDAFTNVITSNASWQGLLENDDLTAVFEQEQTRTRVFSRIRWSPAAIVIVFLLIFCNGRA